MQQPRAPAQVQSPVEKWPARILLVKVVKQSDRGLAASFGYF